MADAYGTFAASGSHYEPYSVTKVLKDSKPLAQFKPPAEQTAMPENVANNVTDVLQNVIQTEPARRSPTWASPWPARRVRPTRTSRRGSSATPGAVHGRHPVQVRPEDEQAGIDERHRRCGVRPRW